MTQSRLDRETGHRDFKYSSSAVLPLVEWLSDIPQYPQSRPESESIAVTKNFDGRVERIEAIRLISEAGVEDIRKWYLGVMPTLGWILVPEESQLEIDHHPAYNWMEFSRPNDRLGAHVSIKDSTFRLVVPPQGNPIHRLAILLNQHPVKDTGEFPDDETGRKTIISLTRTLFRKDL